MFITGVQMGMWEISPSSGLFKSVPFKKENEMMWRKQQGNISSEHLAMHIPSDLEGCFNITQAQAQQVCFHAHT